MYRATNLICLGLLLATAAQAIPEGPEPNTPEWFAREQANYAKVLEAPAEQLAPGFQQRLQAQSLANEAEWIQRGVDDPSWFSPQSGNSNLTPLCSSWMEQCAGDPFRYPGVDPFYDNEVDMVPFVIYDAQCARLSGRLWAPKSSAPGDELPTVVIETGSVQAPETLYWWMAQALVRADYVVLSFDVRGQGRSDFQSPAGDQGGNSDATVFWDGLVNVIDFFHSTPQSPYPHNASCAETYPTAVTDVNPFWERMDFSRLGLAGHSLGASGVSQVQAYGADDAEPWPGLQDSENPVDVIVAWDSLANFSPRVPAMGQSSEYGLTPAPKASPPDPEAHKGAYAAWKQAGLPVYQLTIQGSSHYEWSLIPTFPTSSWCPQTSNNRCEGGWGRPLAEHYSLAWFDRWLKRPGETGYDDADTRLLADGDWVERYSFYYRSARNFPDRNGLAHNCEDIRAGCDDDANSVSSMPGSGGGGAMSWWLLLVLPGLLWLWRRSAKPKTAPPLEQAQSTQIDEERFQAVSIRPGLDSCKAVWLLVGERYLADAAPTLPVEGCDKEHCECRYNEHEDRREPGERRVPDLDEEAAAEAEKTVAERSRGRRQDD